MLDATAYPHILDAVIANADDSALLALRAAGRISCNRVDAHLFRHVAVVFSSQYVTARRPWKPAPRLPLLPLAGVGEDGGAVRRWRRALGFTAVADLHGTSSTEPAQGWEHLSFNAPAPHEPRSLDRPASLASFPIPIVRDMRDTEGPSPFPAREWHTYLWRNPQRAFVSPPRGSPVPTVLHLRLEKMHGSLAFAMGRHTWEELQAATRDFTVPHVVVVRHKGGWPFGRSEFLWAGWPVPVDMGPLTEVLAQMLNGHLTLVGWEELGADELALLVRPESLAVPGVEPLAIRAIMHDIGRFRSADGWRQRISWLTVEEWRQASASPKVAEIPPGLAVMFAEAEAKAAIEREREVAAALWLAQADERAREQRKKEWKPRRERACRRCVVM